MENKKKEDNNSRRNFLKLEYWRALAPLLQELC